MNMHSVQVTRSAQRHASSRANACAPQNIKHADCHRGSLPRATGMAAIFSSHMLYHQSSEQI